MPTTNLLPSTAGSYNLLSLIGAGLGGIGFNTTAGIATGLGNATNYLAGLSPGQQSQDSINNAGNLTSYAASQAPNPGTLANQDIASQPFLDTSGFTTPSDNPNTYDDPYSNINNYVDSSLGIWGGGYGDASNMYASGGVTTLSQGRLLKGPGDGMSDSIPAQIVGGNRPPEPAALGDGEFVIPADVVSHLGNGSTEAGSKRLYEMLDKVRQARTGKKAQAPQVNPQRFMPA